MARQLDRPVGESSRKALKPILDAAKSNLRTNDSVNRGVLLRGMVIRKRKQRLLNGASWHVTASGKAIGIAHLVEFGTEPHYQPKRGQMHPGAKPKPYLTPAFYDHEDDAIRIFGQEIGGDLERQAARLAKRGRAR